LHEIRPFQGLDGPSERFSRIPWKVFVLPTLEKDLGSVPLDFPKLTRRFDIELLYGFQELGCKMKRGVSKSRRVYRGKFSNYKTYCSKHRRDLESQIQAFSAEILES
jgi:hypothetical protein